MPHVETASPQQRRAALVILLQDLAPPVRAQQIRETMDAAERGDIALDGLLVAQSDGITLGVVLFVLQPDQCGFVWPPVVSTDAHPDEAEHIADALLQAVGQRLDEMQAWLGQCLLETENDRDAGRLQRNGFEFLTDLTYLRRSLDRDLDIGHVESSLIAEPVDPDRDAARLGAVIERTYSGTADCPQLNGLRAGLDAVAGHRATGVPLVDGWMIFHDATGDVGVLLLADQPDQNACELVYMGVVPEARGRGYGRKIVETSVRRAAMTKRRDLLLAVDERNRFATAIYESAGFEFLDRKRVYIRRSR